MNPVLARLKRGVREVIQFCGGIDGAAATAQRRRSVSGDWNNLNSGAFPPLECALAMDEAALAQQRRPAILHAYAAELGHAAVPLPEGAASDDLTGSMIELGAEFGDVAASFRDMEADRLRTADELRALDVQLSECLASGVAMQGLVRAELAAMRARGKR